ncbi:unnamed protein product [Litomosoides sigmodontis]|uniref:Large ribosomal subunit protein P2 n=1 Tax=Litomosoides sigmodontis TaxID=42156 RepID=A0A3P6S7H1_LITSI|nr:unnamed protein product [Litomosoides sigmodontis]
MTSNPPAALPPSPSFSNSATSTTITLPQISGRYSAATQGESWSLQSGTMKYLAAHLLSTMGGNKSPTAKDIENILGSVGLDVDMEDANKVVSALSGKSIDEVITAGLEKISSVSFGGTASTVAPVTSAAPAGAPETGSKKEEKKEEPKEESDDDMGFGLFD